MHLTHALILDFFLSVRSREGLKKRRSKEGREISKILELNKA